MGNNKSTFVKVGLAIGALGVTYMLAAYVIPRAIVSMTKAAPATKVSLNETRVLGQKILCKADGVDRCVVNVFVLDSTSKGVKGKRVSLSGQSKISPESVVTDDSGKAAFNITSTKEGQETLTAEVEGMSLDKDIKVTFRN